MSGHPPRQAAARALAAVANGQSLAVVLPAVLADVQVEHRPLTQELVYSTLREWPRLAGIARQQLKKPLKARDNDVFSLILMGLQQISGMRIPHHAAVSETVNTARKLGKSWATSLVNGVLRNYQRESAQLESSLTPAERGALPEWLFEAIGNQWPEQQLAIAAASRGRPPMTLRVNLSRISREEYLSRLEAAGLPAISSQTNPTAVTLTTPSDVGQIPGFEEGLVSVQDDSAQLAALLLNAQPGEAVFDACAAPGGKACHILEAQPLANLVVGDVSAARLARVEENLRRLGLAPEVIAVDATCPEQILGSRLFDAVIADVPCSATGVMRRNPDIKVHRSSADVGGFGEQQRAILEGLWPLVKPRGRLLYVSCSILREENDTVIQFALDSLPGAELRTLTNPSCVPTNLGLQRLPDPDGGDGLYFAMLGKSEH